MSQPRPRSGPSIGVMLISIVLIIIAFYTLNLALSTFSSDVTLATLYFTVAVLSFGFVVLSVFRVRRGYALANPAPLKVMSIVKCPQCSFKQIKNFAVGDFVFKKLGMCTQCGVASLSITGIYYDGPTRR
ncbi:hypothetical protein E6H17_02790 [Candidatus Bathyarchaeota archaeon]|nr:MAG: hypothetical protein E6H17_02790 [Candidatus Bathyarchaeota archaeon]TMI76390.1 MAG: hypothetical protein E6H11_00755 [Candidatus Bathyarchaeota archaeon]